ncbi:MAG: hypothetical protein KGN80_06325 [Acidobacteriota bacterium]|nr:hypothetical protein [Acidobacteriota bacterium]
MTEDSGARVSIPTSYWVTVGVIVVVLSAAFTYVVRNKHQHGVGAFGYLGAEKCRQCHEKQFKDWQETRMARSFEVLKPGVAVEAKRIAKLDPNVDFTHDSSCLPCHTTGYGLVGGFSSIEQTPQMAGVTCEACHGPGGGYVETVMSRDKPSFLTKDAVRQGLNYPPTEAVCRVCHNENSPFVGMAYVFDFKERVSRGTHHHYPLQYKHDKPKP